MNAEPYTWDDIVELEEEWMAVFGEPVLRGFGVGPAQVPILNRCLEERSKEPIERYVASLSTDRDY